MALLRSHAFVYRKPLSRSTILTNLLQTFIGCNVHYPIYLSIETFFALHKNMQPLNYFIYWCCSSVKTTARDNVKYKLYSKTTYIYVLLLVDKRFWIRRIWFGTFLALLDHILIQLHNEYYILIKYFLSYHLALWLNDLSFKVFTVERILWYQGINCDFVKCH